MPCCFGAGRCSSSNGSSRLVFLISSLRSSVLVRVPEVTLDTFSVRFWACSSFRALLFWCREVLLVLFCQQQQQQQRQQRQQPSSISHQFPQVFSSSRVSEVTLGTFSVRFCGLFVLPCLAVLVPGAALATLLSAAAEAAAAARAVLVPGGAFGQQQQQQQRQRQQPSSISHQFSLISSLRSSVLVRVPEVTLDTFSVRFCGLFVLPCLAVSVPGGAAAATAAAV